MTATLRQCGGKRPTPIALEHRPVACAPSRHVGGSSVSRFQTCWTQRQDAYVPLGAVDLRMKYTIDASTSTIPVTTNSRTVAWARIQRMARMASAGTIFIPGKLNGSPSERTSCCTKVQQAAQQRKYISKTATFESTASCSKVPLSDSANASVA